MKITLFDPPSTRLDLLPFTFTRPISKIRVGILNISEKWEHLLKAEVGHQTADYLQHQFQSLSPSNYLIRSNVLPDQTLIEAILQLKPYQSLVDGNGDLIALNSSYTQENFESLIARSSQNEVPFDTPLVSIENLWDIFQNNGRQIESDFQLLTAGRSSQNLNDPNTIVYNTGNIFIEDGVTVRAAILNALDGPIYLGKNSQINEGAIVQGPFALGENSIVNVGAKIRKNTSTGPNCKIGGEVSNAVIFGNSNKSHDGFLGNSVIGEWCNIGADTNTSNLKNNYSEVKIWNYRQEKFIPTGSQFCGLMMADHGKCAINTMFNTGTVTGVAANIFGAGFPRTSVPSFSWGGAAGYKTFEFNKAMEASSAMMERRGRVMTTEERQILTEVYQSTSKYRIWENKGK